MPFYGVGEKDQSLVRIWGLMEGPRYDWRTRLPRIRRIPFELFIRVKTISVIVKADTRKEKIYSSDFFGYTHLHQIPPIIKR